MRWALAGALYRMGQYSDAWQAVQRGGGQLGPRNKQDASLLLDLTRRFGDRDKLFRDAVRLLRAYGDDEQFSATALVTAYTPSAESRPEQVVEPDDTEQETEDHVEESLAELHTVTADFFSRYPDSTLFRRITFTDPQEAIEQMAEMMSQGAAARDNLYRQVADGALPAGILTAVGVRTYVEAFLLRAGNALRVESANPTDLALEDADAIPDRYRTLAATAAFTGLRWGECAGLFWEAVDLGARRLRVVRVLIEVSGQISVKPYPKSRAGRRSVPCRRRWSSCWCSIVRRFRRPSWSSSTRSAARWDGPASVRGCGSRRCDGPAFRRRCGSTICGTRMRRGW